jgi:hypothetical protein
MLTLKEKFSSFPADSIIEKIIFLEHLCCNGNISSVVLLSVFLITFLFPSLTEKIIKMVPLQKGHFRRHNWKIKHHLTCGRMEFLPQVKYSKVSVFSDHTPVRPYKDVKTPSIKT